MKVKNIIRFIEPLKEDIRLHFKTQEVLKGATNQEFKFWDTYKIDIDFYLMFSCYLYDDEIEEQDMEKILQSFKELEEENIYFKRDKNNNLLFYKNDKIK